jgi:trans-2,3-dihydro-3-hydroxyanthranilate isomerase
MASSRRHFLQTGASSLGAAFTKSFAYSQDPVPQQRSGGFHIVQIDVFSAHRLQGNALAVFTDARGLSDSEMQDIARETNLQETTFVFPRSPAVEKEHGVKVRIFIREQEIPFGGHPTLGTAMVLRNRRLAQIKKSDAGNDTIQDISLDLQVGRIPVTFREDDSGRVFGEMHQIDPVFGPTHDRATVAALVGVKSADISDEWPIQTISTGLQFAIVPLKRLSTLQSLRPDLQKIRAYFEREPVLTNFYYVTRETQESDVGLRSRGLFTTGEEDPATGSASGCTAAWMVRYGIAQPGQVVHIQQGVEMKRPSHIFVRANKHGEKIVEVRVGGYAVEVMEGEFSL